MAVGGQKAQITVRFEGQDEPVVLKLKPVGLIAVERKWGGNAFTEHQIEAMMLAAFVGIGMPGGEGGFDAWSATIEEIVTDEADPTLATPAEPSPLSQ